MSDLRKDPITGRWVIVDTEHPSLPLHYGAEPHIQKETDCPFCYGNENLTPTEIESFRDPQTVPNTPGWYTRVVPNKYPALKIEGSIDRKGLGIYDLSNGIGAHEVLIESPYHAKDTEDLLVEEIERSLSMANRRSQDLRKDSRFKYIMIFKNYGPAAGASIDHPHMQIIALPMIPKNVLEEINGAKDYFKYRERCIFCDMLIQERSEGERIIQENNHFTSFCPFVSRFPFEIWILPKAHQNCFCVITAEQIPALAMILKDTIRRIKDIFGNIAYNYIIHSSPCAADSENESFHWHIEIMPKLMRVAGFEWGSGCYIVPTPPELAAQYLRNNKAP